MKNLTKRLLGLLLAVAMVITLIPAYANASESTLDKTGAMAILLSNKVEGNIATNGTNPVYKFQTVSYSAYYDICVKNIDVADYITSKGVQIKIYDEDGAAVDNMQAACGQETHFYVKLNPDQLAYLQAYTLGTSTGTFYLTVTPEADAGDTLLKANDIKFGEEYKESLRTSSDVDVYEFLTPNYAAKYSLTLKNISVSDSLMSKGINYQIIDEDGALVYDYSRGAGTESTDDFKLDKNSTYFIVFKTSTINSGEYKFSLTATKEEGDTKSTAKAISVGKKYTSYLTKYTKDDIDWYSFKASATTKYKFSVKNVDVNNTITVKVYSGSKKVKEFTAAYGKSVSASVKLSKGAKISVKICSSNKAVGKYTLKVSK